MQPRIYTYKITFEEVPYYYYGSHKEKKYNEYYMGSPVTHKLMWDFYTPKKQILEIFNSREDANIIENRLIKPVDITSLASKGFCSTTFCRGKLAMCITTSGL